MSFSQPFRRSSTRDDLALSQSSTQPAAFERFPSFSQGVNGRACSGAFDRDTSSPFSHWCSGFPNHSHQGRASTVSGRSPSLGAFASQSDGISPEYELSRAPTRMLADDVGDDASHSHVELLRGTHMHGEHHEGHHLLRAEEEEEGYTMHYTAAATCSEGASSNRGIFYQYDDDGDGNMRSQRPSNRLQEMRPQQLDGVERAADVEFDDEDDDNHGGRQKYRNGHRGGCSTHYESSDAALSQTFRDAPAVSPLVPPPVEFFRQHSEVSTLISTALRVMITWAAATHQGPRSKQEDAFILCPDIGGGLLSPLLQLCAVFDGHGGGSTSDFLQRTFEAHVTENIRRVAATSQPAADGSSGSIDIGCVLVDAIRHADTSLLEQNPHEATACGSTACVAAVHGRTLFIANLGDSRAVLSECGCAVQLTEDHRPGQHPREKERLMQINALEHDRVFGSLAVSRAVGDFQYKGRGTTPSNSPSTSALSSQTRNAFFSSQQQLAPPYHYEPEEVCAVSNVADVHTYAIHDGSEFVIIATDGLWDVMTPDEAVAFVHEHAAREAEETDECEFSGCRTPRNKMQSSVDALVKHAVKSRNTSDNVTAVIVAFH